LNEAALNQAALYQGNDASLAVGGSKDLGFSPCALFLEEKQGLKPNSLSILYGTTKVVP
jgi:hypothetical protein